MEQLAFPLDQGNSDVMQQRCMTYRCIYFVALFNLNGRKLSELISPGMILDVGV